MAAKNIPLVGATLNDVKLFELFRDRSGAPHARVDAAAPGQVVGDVQEIAIADTSLTNAEKTALQTILGKILADVQAREGYE